MYEDDLDLYDDMELDELDEFEDDADFAGEFEDDELEEMEYLMEGALMAESEEEEDAFLGALVSMATKALPSVLSVGRKVLPKLVGAAKHVVSAVGKDPNVRRAAKSGVNVLTRTAQDVARRYSQGRPVTGRYIARKAAGHTSRVIPYAVYGKRGHPSWSRQRSKYRRPRCARRPSRRPARSPARMY